MAFTFSVKDTYRQAVEASSGGKQTVLYDKKGIPSIMNIIPKFSYADIGIGNSTKALDAFVINGKELPEIFIGTYAACVHDGRAYSLPGQVPKVYTTHDQAVAYCREKGDGWHATTRAEKAAIALWCKKNGYYPRGNNNYGHDYSAPHETCRPGTVGSDGRINLGLTGSGPNSWTHDGTPNGIYGLNGDCYEWDLGIRTVDGEIQIIPENNAALPNADLSPTSPLWRAILQDGTLVAPGTAGTLKLQPSNADSGTPTIVTTVTNHTTDSTSMSSKFKDVAVGSGIVVPDVLKALGVYHMDATDHGDDYFYARNNGERCFLSGGAWYNASSAGVFSLHSGYPRSLSADSVGFRPAFVNL